MNCPVSLDIGGKSWCPAVCSWLLCVVAACWLIQTDRSANAYPIDGTVATTNGATLHSQLLHWSIDSAMVVMVEISGGTVSTVAPNCVHQLLQSSVDAQRARAPVHLPVCSLCLCLLLDLRSIRGFVLVFATRHSALQLHRNSGTDTTRILLTYLL